MQAKTANPNPQPLARFQDGPLDPRGFWAKTIGTAVWRRLIARFDGPIGKPLGRAYSAAVVKVDRLGDFVLALGAIRTVLAHFGQERCVLIVSPFAEEVARREFPATDVVVVPAMLTHRQLWREASGARRLVGGLRVDTVVCLRHQRWDYEELLLSWFHAPRVWRIEDGYARSVSPWDRLYDAPQDGLVPAPRSESIADGAPSSCRELAYHRALLAAVLGRAVDPREIEPRLVEAGTAAGVLVSPFGSEPIKDFPTPLLREAVIAAFEAVGGPLTFVGTSAQRDRLAQLARDVCGGRDHVVNCELGMAAYFGLVARASLVISTDTATAHLAVAMDKPAVVALGGGHWGRFGPWSRSAAQVWLSHEVPCRGCHWRCAHPKPLCLTEIPAGRARDAVNTVLLAASARACGRDAERSSLGG